VIGYWMTPLYVNAYLLKKQTTNDYNILNDF